MRVTVALGLGVACCEFRYRGVAPDSYMAGEVS